MGRVRKIRSNERQAPCRSWLALGPVLALVLVACSGDSRAAADAAVVRPVDASAVDALPPRLPINVLPAGEGFVQFDLNGRGGCGLREDGSILCWGGSNASACDIEEWSVLACHPEGVFTSLSVGATSVCGVQEDNRVLCSYRKRFFLDPGLVDEFFLSVSTGGSHFCGVTLEGQIQCYFGTETAPAGTFVATSAGGQNDCAIGTDGTLDCWRPYGGAALLAPDGQFISVVNQHDRRGTFEPEGACALATDGTVSCFDMDGATTAPDGVFDQIVAGADHYCARRQDGTVACWGRGVSDHECGNNSDGWNPAFVKECGQAKPPADSFAWLAAADNYTCGLKADGDLVCWGHLPWDVCASENSAGTPCPHEGH